MQTRNAPQSYDRTASAFDIRIRPSDHERLPSAAGLNDLRDTIAFLPDAVTRTAAQRLRIRGGAHLCVAFTLGAALPSTRVGHIEVMDQRRKSWTSSGEASLSTPPHISIETQGVNGDPITTGRRAVAVFLDLMTQSSNAAFERYLEENRQHLSAWQHLRSTGGDLLDNSVAGEIAAEAAARIRTVANDHANAGVHVAAMPLSYRHLAGQVDQHTTSDRVRVGRQQPRQRRRRSAPIRADPAYPRLYSRWRHRKGLTRSTHWRSKISRASP